MRFSRRTSYGLMLLGELAPTFRSGEPVSLRAVAARRRLPYPFLAKIAAALRRGGILSAEKGASGGYRLTRNPNSVTVRDVARIFEDTAEAACFCSSGSQRSCPHAPSCPVRRRWAKLERAVGAVFEKATIASLS